jgi:hypothetical protein
VTFETDYVTGEQEFIARFHEAHAGCRGEVVSLATHMIPATAPAGQERDWSTVCSITDYNAAIADADSLREQLRVADCECVCLRKERLEYRLAAEQYHNERDTERSRNDALAKDLDAERLVALGLQRENERLDATVIKLTAERDAALKGCGRCTL